jgi:CheY-like chemotaxis protein
MYRIAVVDDNQSWCFVLKLRLQQEGYAVSTFANARAFLQEAEQFDLALIDFSIPAPVYQPDMDGPELISELRRLDRSPILVLISSFFTEDVLNDASSICPEADAILSKQTETSRLFSQIRQLLNSRKGADSIRPRS